MTREKPRVRVSVRAVVELTHHAHDLSAAIGQMQRMQEGAAAHRMRQSAAEAADARWHSEVPLAADYEGEGVVLRVTGRADAILRDAVPTIEEIKLGAPGEPLQEAHLAQAAFYGHMLCQSEGFARARLRVQYVSPAGEALARYEQDWTAEALRAHFEALSAPAARQAEERLAHLARRDQSLQSAPFPYACWRPGQKRFAAGIWQAALGRKRLFAQAPTGIGKTVAALVPALRTLGETGSARVIFLTARTTGRRSALDAAGRMLRGGAWFTACEIGAKDKVCPRAIRDCRPEICPMAAGFFDRLPAALEAVQGGMVDLPALQALAQAHDICPFELSLALAVRADLVVCDYNYIYDPVVALRDLLTGGAILLVDEAHQLAPRVRDAYSARLDTQALRTLRAARGKQAGRADPLYRASTALLRAIEAEAARPGFGEAAYLPDRTLGEAVSRLCEAASLALSLGGGELAASLYRLALGWLQAEGRYDAQRYACLSGGKGKTAWIELCLLDPAPEILAVSKRARGTAYFSATLSPQRAVRRILGGEEGDLGLTLPSPFDPAHLSVRVAPIDVRYAVREQSAPRVAQAIREHLFAGRGNAIVFFPSYAYLALLAPMITQPPAPAEFLLERRGMDEGERSAMLEALCPGRPVPAALLAVLGGAFSEAVDLSGDRLGSVVVVSTGMPTPDPRSEALRRCYDAAGEDGFFLTMTLPGMTRVIQAAGRLIRTPEDRGRLLLIDKRFERREIRALLSGTLLGDALHIPNQRQDEELP